MSAPMLPDGIVAIVKRACPTCELVAPVLAQLASAVPLTVYTQDDPEFPPGVDAVHDRDLAVSWHNDIDTVPTLLRVEEGKEAERIVGWLRDEWETFTGVGGLGAGLPDWRPGCGSMSVDPDRVDELRVRFSGTPLRSRHIELAAAEDPFEAMFERGLTDGLPVVPPTEARVLAMLEGTTRSPDDVVAVVPPDLVEATLEKVAVNAVMAGCRPEHLPVVLAALEAVCTDTFNMHGVLATTMPVGPILVVNGPIRRQLGMNSGVNVLGQGNRANSSIGRAVQLVVRNLGGGAPGGVDRATHGNPGKLSFCFAEDEEGSPWEPLHASRGVAAERSAVTAYCGEGPRCVVDQKARHPDELVATLAACLRTVHHPKLPFVFDAMLVVGPEHARVFAEAGWDRAHVLDAINARLQLPLAEIVQGAGDMAEGLPHPGEDRLDGAIPKFRPGGLLLVHAGGEAGLFSAIMAGWASGALGSEPVTREITP